MNPKWTILQCLLITRFNYTNENFIFTTQSELNSEQR